MSEQEIEVYRSKLEVEKYYETAEYTKKTGSWFQQNEKYFTTVNKLNYVGKYIKTERIGWGDGGRVWEVFDDNGKKIIVEYNYEGTTCFRETNPSNIYVLK
jgi:hypothetical protein